MDQYQRIVQALEAQAAKEQAEKPRLPASAVPWGFFVKFIQNADMWSRWSYDQNLAPEDTYFLNALEDIKNSVARQHYDFELGDPQVFSIEGVNWEHDGESLSHFFKIFHEGRRV